jgi:hypothetical protein
MAHLRAAHPGSWFAAVKRAWSAGYPAAFGVTYVLLSFGTFPTPTTDLLRPLAIVIIATAGLTLATAAILRSLPRAALVVSVLAVAVSAPFLLAAVVAAAAIAVGWQVVRGRWSIATMRQASAPAASSAAGIFALAFLAVGVALASPSIASGWLAAGNPAPREAGSDRPNIYLLLLDGYPRGDTLASVYGYDNTWFEDALQNLGFAVAPHSRSNYPQTPLTLASMFNGAYLEDIAGLQPPPESAQEQYRRLMAALNDAPMTDRLRQAGYEIDSIPSPFSSDALSTADRTFNSGQITSFEYSLLIHSQLAPLIVGLVPDFLMSQQRDRFSATLDRLVAESSSDRGGPAFLFAHVFSPPHAPLVFGPGGERLPLPDCVPAPCDLWEFPPDAWARLPGQIHYTNGEVLKAVSQIVRSDPTGIIVLTSDHGSRRDPADLDEFFHNFFAARTPGLPPFPADISPVNVMRLLVSMASGQQLDPVPYQAWFFADEQRPLELTPFQPTP